MKAYDENGTTTERNNFVNEFFTLIEEICYCNLTIKENSKVEEMFELIYSGCCALYEIQCRLLDYFICHPEERHLFYSDTYLSEYN